MVVQHVTISIINMQVIIVHTFVSFSNWYISYMHYYTWHLTILLKVVRNKDVYRLTNMAKNIDIVQIDITFFWIAT